MVNAQAQALWDEMRVEAQAIIAREPMLKELLQHTVLECRDLADGLARIISARLANAVIGREPLYQMCISAYREDAIIEAICADFRAVCARDPASSQLTIPFLYLKGAHALEAWRVAHFLYIHGRHDVARYLQSVISDVFAVDIHPAARIGKGIMLDHATGIVIGETAVVGDNVSILQDVTLGGTGKENGDRHPKVGSGVMIGAGAKILGNIQIGEGAKIGAGSVVLHAVMPHTTVAGIPARVVGKPREAQPALAMDQDLDAVDPRALCTLGCGISFRQEP